MKPVLISDGIYIGERQSVKEYGINHVVNLALEEEEGSINCHVIDSVEETPQMLLKAAEMVAAMVKANQTPLYVHCELGISRSPVVVALALVLLKRFETIEAALSFIRKVYPRAIPNPDLMDKAKMALELRKQE